MHGPDDAEDLSARDRSFAKLRELLEQGWRPIGRGGAPQRGIPIAQCCCVLRIDVVFEN
jgi:hypothetical protein